MATLVRTILLLVACLTPVVTRAQVATAYILADHTSGYVLESYKADQKRPIASLTKIATAKVVLDWAAKTGTDLSQLISIPLQAIRPIGNNPMGLQPDDQMSYRDLLYSSLMASDNTAANALAFYVGSVIRSQASSELQGIGYGADLVRECGWPRTTAGAPTLLDRSGRREAGRLCDE
jgi:serine-type D-Ala-D-Ala carboxypeptidase (penicillin-binding protein 5/6)